MYLDTSYCQFDSATKQLYCTLPWDNSIIRIRSWSEGCRVEIKEKDGWQMDIDNIDIPVISDLLTGGDKNHPIACYERELPQKIVQNIAPFAYGQLAMLQVCAASTRGKQLLEDAPVLFWLIAPELLSRSEGEPQALHSLLGLRKRDLITLICGRGNNSLVRLLGKVPPPGNVYASQKILTAILSREDACSLLRHKAKVDWLLLVLIVRQGERINSAIVRNIIMSNIALPDMAKLLGKLDEVIRDTIRLGEELRIANAAETTMACAGWKSLWSLHEAWTKRLNSVKIDALVEKYGEKLPPPPLQGTDDIQPIDSVGELLLEGQIMHHCVGSYINTVRSGGCYIYKILKPERATLEIIVSKTGDWRVSQLKSYCNSAPSAHTFKHVQKWLIEKSRKDVSTVAPIY